MNPSRQGWKWQILVVAVGGAIACFEDCALAQNITLDGTLGPTGALVGPNYVIPQAVGQTVGSNLFHSFGRFSLNTGESANFRNAANIRNILARVTGGFPSSIDGAIFTDGGVNLFLINPSGILFGPNASINVGDATRGSFVATTVDALVWSNGSQFSATNPGSAGSLLTIVGDPSGFLAAQRVPQSIAATGSNLVVAPGQSLEFLGGNVNLDGATLQAPGGRVELGGMTGIGTVGLDVNGNNLSLSFPNGVERADVSLANQTQVDVTAAGRGDVAINARNLNVLGGSSLTAGIGKGLGAIGSQGGEVTLDATEAVTITGSNISNLVGRRAIGRGGDIVVRAKSFTLNDGAEIAAVTLGQGDAGKILIQANDAVLLTGDSTIFNTVVPGAVGNSGGVKIEAGTVFMTMGAELQASTSGQGNAGNVTIQARDRVAFDGVDSQDFASGIFSTVMPGGIGNGGDITITTGSLALTNGGRIQTNIRNRGKAGNVEIRASGDVSIDGIGTTDASEIATTVGTGGIGPGGDIQITAKSLFITNGGNVNASTFGEGSGGNINVQVNDSVVLDGVNNTRSNPFSSNLSSVVGNDRSAGVGNGGNVNITTRSLAVTNGANITASTGAQGNAGNITIQASGPVFFGGIGSDGSSSLAISGVVPTAVGDGGNVEIHAESIVLKDGAEVSAVTAGQGNAGNVTLESKGSIAFDGVSPAGFSSGAFTAVNPGGVGKGGNIDVTTTTLSVTNGAALVASTSGLGDSGQIEIRARDWVTFDGMALDNMNGVLSSRAFSGVAPGAVGNGGKIAITTELLKVTNGAELSLSSLGNGSAGNLEINARSLQIDNQSRLTTETAAGNGGNIMLNVQDLLLLRRHSLISTTAGTNQAGGNGGNIALNTKFIVAVPKENSDISANAYTGRGGNIQINTQGIFGTQFRPQNTPLSDITASSTLGVQGVVNISTPGIDPSRGLSNLPPAPIDASRQIAQGCYSGGAVASQQNKFVITGRGGLPPNPREALNSDAVEVNWVALNPPSENRADTATPVNPDRTPPTPTIAEAQGWVYGPNGEIILTAAAPKLTPQNAGLQPATCPQL